MEIGQAINEPKKKANNESGLVSEHLHMGGHHLHAIIINTIIKNRDIPNILKSGILHPTHKKKKPLSIAGNYRRITTIKIIGKVLDIMLARHLEVAIPKTHDLQFSFTKGKAPSYVTLMMTEAMSEMKDNGKPCTLCCNYGYTEGVQRCPTMV